MLFNSIEFVIFFILVFFIYWKLNRKKQNIFIIICSYIFYGWWDWRFLTLIFISTIVDFFLGKKIYQNDSVKVRRIYLTLSVLINIGILGFFKYFNFFVSSFQEIFYSLGVSVDSLTTLNVILPVGISFYTFQTLSYSIEIYQKKISPTKSFTEFMAFVSFFPQLVAGPIERASALLSQFAKERIFEIHKAIDGCRQILWGLFKKIVIADTLALIVNNVYGGVNEASGVQLLIATIFFAFQIYCDFSGYSDIAIGTSRLLGIKLSRNFAYPYFSRNIAEFWRRWHISLSTWFRDYIFIPLGGNHVSNNYKYLFNILITFILSGLWHGANWTFIFWGFLHGLYYVPYIFSTKSKKAYKSLDEPANLKNIPKIFVTFLFVLIGWVFFRADSIGQGFIIIGKIFSDFSINATENLHLDKFLIIVFLLVVEWFQRKYSNTLDISRFNLIVRRIIYIVLIILIILLGKFNYTPFIYFQF